MWETSIGCPSNAPQLRDETPSLVCVLTRTGTSNSSLYMMMHNQLSHTGRGASKPPLRLSYKICLPFLLSQHAVWPSEDLGFGGWDSAPSPSFLSGCDPIYSGKFDASFWLLKCHSYMALTFTLQQTTGCECWNLIFKSHAGDLKDPVLFYKRSPFSM